MAEPDTLRSGATWLRDAFINVQEQLELNLRQASASIAHAGSQGAVNEEHWIEVFRAYLPKRYEVASAFVIDSRGSRSQQIDIVIFDRHFTPTLLDQKSHRYIPAEAVYAVFESKPHIDKDYLAYAGEKAASVRRLYRTSSPITHAGGTFAPRPPFSIVAGIVAQKCAWKDGFGESFRSNLALPEEASLNCGCALENGAFDTFADELRIVPRGGALIYFLFRLLARLQALGSVPAVDWSAYARMLEQRP